MRSPPCLSSRFGLLSGRERVPLSPTSPAAIALSLILLAGCGGGDIVLPGGEPASIAVVDGDDQRGRVGEPLGNPLVVEVTDSRGLTVAGATVAFEFSSAGAGAAVVPEEKTTDANGRAEAQLVLGTTIGRQTGQARVVGGAGGAPIQATFSATALPENANTMAAVAGQDQTGHVGLPLDDRLVVEVTDGFGNPVAGVPISWAAVGGGSVSADLVETDGDGRSRVDRVLGPAVGQQSAVASSEGLAGSPVTFVHTAIAGDASRLVILSGGDQTGEAGALLPADLVVQLIDSDGNGVPQTAVSWVVATGGGSVAPEISTTDGSGRTSARWTLGGTLGQQRLDAVVSGVGVATFRATATAGAPASLVIRTQPSGSARNGTPLSRQPVLQLRDSQGNDAAQAGIQVTAIIGSGGGELGGTRQVATDGSGRATFTDLSISGGPGPRTLVFTAPGYAQVTSNEVDLQAIGTTTTITGDSPDPSGVDAPFTVSFTVGSQGPTPTGSVTVSDGVQSCSGPLANGSGSCQLSLTTAGTRTLTASYSGEPGLGGSLDTEPHSVTQAPPPPPATTTTTITADDPDPSVSRSNFTVSFQVASTGGTPAGSVRVTVSGGSANCTGELSGGSGSCQLSLITVGDRTLTATYSGGPGFSPSAGTASHTVSRPNNPPHADFNWHCEGLTCSFTDRSSDNDGSISGRHWDWGDGTSTDNELNPSHTYAAPGNYRVILTVTDNGGSTDTAEDTVNPKAPQNKAPKAEFDVACTNLTCSFTDKSSDDDGTVVSRSWDYGDGSSGAEASHTYAGAGTYQVTLTVTDNGGAVGSQTHDAHPTAPPPASTTTTINSDDPDPSNPNQAFTVAFTVISTSGTPRGTVTVGDGFESCTGDLAGGSGSCSLALTTTGPRTLTATYPGDASFNGSSDTEPHTVNSPPTAAFTFTCTDLTCSFDSGGSSDPGGSIVSQSWDFGDAGTGSGDPPSHTFPATGTYPVTLTVTDNNGATAQATQPVTVPPPAAGVLGLVTQPPSRTQRGRRLQPEPHIELRDAASVTLTRSGVTVSAAIASGSGALGGILSRATNSNGRAKFEELRVNGPVGASVMLAFTAGRFAQVDSQPILIEED
ncbi:MAG: PKD domain-containing protein [Gemmatimonadales bacterium]